MKRKAQKLTTLKMIPRKDKLGNNTKKKNGSLKRNISVTNEGIHKIKKCNIFSEICPDKCKYKYLQLMSEKVINEVLECV